MGRECQAIACGVLVAGGLVDVPIARHGTDATHGRHARRQTGDHAFRDARALPRHTHLALKLETGRTHQIACLAFMHHPLLGDPVWRPAAPATQAAATNSRRR